MKHISSGRVNNVLTDPGSTVADRRSQRWSRTRGWKWMPALPPKTLILDSKLPPTFRGWQLEMESLEVIRP